MNIHEYQAKALLKSFGAPVAEGVHQLTVRKLVGRALDLHLARLPELLPEALLQELRLPTLQEALVFVHRPPPGTDLAKLEQGRHPALRHHFSHAQMQRLSPL